MVSFFGLKVGGKKKKSSKSPEPGSNQWKRVDQDAMGEGQFFGKNLHAGGVINGSIREGPSRPGTSASTRPGLGGFKSPYAHETHNFAASSMYDLSNVSHTQLPTFPGLKTSHSDANLRTQFGNGSSTSLAPPTLGKPVPGFSSRPSTANGKAKPWVNPLDVHFMRGNPTAPPAPKSPLGQFEIPPTPKSLDGDGHSLFGDKTTDNVVDDVFASIEQKEKDEREAREREREEEQKRLMENLAKERQERQERQEQQERQERQERLERLERQERQQRLEREKSNEAYFGPGVPPAAEAANPMFRGNTGPRPASPAMRQGNGPLPPPGFRGQNGQRSASPGPGFRDPHGPRTASPGPGFRGHPGVRSASPGPGAFRDPHGPRTASPGPAFRGQHGPRPASPGPAFRGNTGQRPASPGPRMNGPPMFQGDMPQRPASPGMGPRPGPGPVFRGNMGERPRSPGPAHAPAPGRSLMRPQGPPQPGPNRRGPSPIGPGPGPGPNSGPGAGPPRPNGMPPSGFAPNGPRPGGPVTGGPPSPGLSGLPPSPGQSGFPTSPVKNKFPPPSGPPPSGRLPDSPGASGFPPLGPPPTGPLPESPVQSGFPPAGPLPAAPVGNQGREDHGPVPQPPPRSRARPSADDAKPVIQNVRAKRETLVVNDLKRLSLSMKIEEFEKSLVQAQKIQQEGILRPEPLKLRPRSGSTSSFYSEEDDEAESISPIAISPITMHHPPAPMHTSPPLVPSPVMTPREQSPVGHGHGLHPRIGQGVHRPRPSEYGVKPTRQQPLPGQGARPRGELMAGGDAPRSAPGPAPGSSLQDNQRARANTPQFHQKHRPEYNTPIQSPESAPAPRSHPEASNGPLASAGFKFDFMPASCPPTPDSLTTSWPLNEPAPRSDGADSAAPAPSAASPTSSRGGSTKGIQRQHVPAPLDFDFSPMANTRAPDGPYTPPLRAAPQMAPMADGRPQTAGNPYSHRGRASPPTIPFPRYEDESPILEPSVPVAGRGVEFVMPDRRPNHGLMSPTGIADQFGTRFL